MRRMIRVLLALVTGFPVAAQVTTLHLAYEDKEQPPYYLGGSTDVPASNPGVAVEMVMAVAALVPHLKVQFTRAPWQRCTTGLGTGTYDGIFNASYRQDRLELGWYPTKDGMHEGPVDVSKRITTIAYALYVSKESGVGWNGQVFSNLNGPIGAPRGYSIVKDLKDIGIDVAEVPGTQNALDMVAARHLAGAALQEVTADALIAKDPGKYGSLVKCKPSLVSKPYYLMLSNAFVKAHPGLARQVWAALEKIRERDMARLLAKYTE